MLVQLPIVCALQVLASQGLAEGGAQGASPPASGQTDQQQVCFAMFHQGFQDVYST